MTTVHATPVTPSSGHFVTAREAIEPLYEMLQLKTDSLVLASALAAGWTLEEASRALAELRLQDALASLRRR